MKKLVTVLSLVLGAANLWAQTYAVGRHSENYIDAARSNRSIQTEVYYPATAAGTDVAVAAGQFPVIVFGHGFVMTWDSYDFFYNYFVSKGYILVMPRSEGNIAPNHGNFGGDLAFLARHFTTTLNTGTGLFQGKVTNKSAIMGHSMGGGSSFLACANNANVTTMVTFAAANTNPSSIDAAASVTIPTLTVAGEKDCVAPPADHQTPMYAGLGGSLKYYVTLLGASHCQFSNGGSFTCNFGEGTCGQSPTITVAEQNQRMIDLAEPWVDYYLKGSCTAWETFTSRIGAGVTGATLTEQHIGTNMVLSTPIIAYTNLLTASATGAVSYQWYLNGNMIANATASTYMPTATGSYTVMVTDAMGCTKTSAPFNFVYVGVQSLQNTFAANIFPNPGNNQLTIFTTANHTDLVFKIIDMNGRICLSQAFKPTANQQTIATNELANGVYQVLLSSETATWSSKWVKIN